MGSYQNAAEARLDLEARVLAAALKQSFERGDMSGARLAHQELTGLLKSRLNKTAEGKESESTHKKGQKSAIADNKQAVVHEIQPTKAKSEVAEKNKPQKISASPAKKEWSQETKESKEKISFYTILSSEPIASFESIHTQFLCLVKALIKRQAKGSSLTTREFREQLRLLCIAHDVLKDPVTRTDYDFRSIGLRGKNDDEQNSAVEDARPAAGSGKTQLKIGELLRCSEILEPSELDIAVDMHKAMPEMPFGLFLVKQGFLTETELDSALFGQSLIQNGKITVAQFQFAMVSMRESKRSFPESLIEQGWITPSDVTSWQKPVPKSLQQVEAESPQMTSSVLSGSASNTKPQTPATEINTHNALPDWAEQLDWNDRPNLDPDAAPSSLETLQLEQQEQDVNQDPVVISLHQQLSVSKAQLEDELPQKIGKANQKTDEKTPSQAKHSAPQQDDNLDATTVPKSACESSEDQSLTLGTEEK